MKDTPISFLFLSFVPHHGCTLTHTHSYKCPNLQFASQWIILQYIFLKYNTKWDLLYVCYFVVFIRNTFSHWLNLSHVQSNPEIFYEIIFCAGNSIEGESLINTVDLKYKNRWKTVNNDYCKAMALLEWFPFNSVEGDYVEGNFSQVLGTPPTYIQLNLDQFQTMDKIIKPYWSMYLPLYLLYSFYFTILALLIGIAYRRRQW